MALSRHHAALGRPLSINEITSQAEKFDFSLNRSLQQWIRSGKLLLTEAAICEQDGDLQRAYLYCYRHAVLVADKLPLHPDYKNPKFKDDLVQMRKAFSRNLQKMEQWRPRIQQECERYVKAKERRDAERQRVLQEREGADVLRLSGAQRRPSLASDEEAFDPENQTLSANEHSEWAVDLAHRELRRRDASRQTTRQAGISPGTVASRRKGIVVNPVDAEQVPDVGSRDDGVREAGRLLERRESASHYPPTQEAASKAYRYPAVPSRENAIDWQMPVLQPRPAPNPNLPPPLLPAKAPFSEDIPPLPPKQAVSSPSSAAQSPPFPQSSRYTFKPTAFTEAGAPLRTVLLPPDLRPSFLNLAHANTAQNRETCGILCGTLISNALFINTLIIPDQTSTSDTCDTTEAGDTALFDYCDSHELLVCGWIHTHPSQSCFLSSRDLHTSSGYQVMLPEAIAIVCAPRHNPDWGIFRLTDPPGLGTVLECRKPGLFHPHDEGGLYTDALRPGHVVEGPGLRFEVVDLRL